MKKVKITVFYLLSVLLTYSQSYDSKLLIPYRKGKLWGYCDTLGNIKIEPKYDEVSFFYENKVTHVFKENKKSFINTKGEHLIPFFDETWQLNQNTFIVKNGKKIGVYYNGKPTVAVEYDKLNYTSGYELYMNEKNKIIFVKNDKYFLIDYVTSEIKEISNPNIESKSFVESASSFSDYENNYITKIKTPIWAVKILDSLKINYELDSLTNIHFNSYYNNDAYAFKFVKLYKKNKVGLWSMGALIKPIYDNIEKIYDAGLIKIIVKKNGKVGVVNEKGDILIPLNYQSVTLLQNSIAITKRKDLYGVVLLASTYKGLKNSYKDLSYHSYLPVNNNWSFLLFKTNKNGHIGYIGENGVEYFKE